jgi:hypothetical protein
MTLTPKQSSTSTQSKSIIPNQYDGRPAGWTDQNESIMLGNLCTSYSAVISDLSGRFTGAFSDEIIGILRKALKQVRAEKKKFDQSHGQA